MSNMQLKPWLYGKLCEGEAVRAFARVSADEFCRHLLPIEVILVEAHYV
jgi:hypothetical protein